jgi:hypothetical protein
VLKDDSQIAVETATVRDNSSTVLIFGTVSITGDLAIAVVWEYSVLFMKNRLVSSSSQSSNVMFAKSATGCKAPLSMNVADPGVVAETAEAMLAEEHQSVSPARQQRFPATQRMSTTLPRARQLETVKMFETYRAQ